MPSSDAEQALTDLLRALARRGYRFITPTPLTHARVLGRPGKRIAHSLADVFGWSLPFDEADAAQLPGAELWALMQAADLVEPLDHGRLRSRIRVSSLDSNLFAHSAYPTDAADAVFFGPDTYRFANFLRANLASDDAPSSPRLADVGCGSGAGGILAAALLRQPEIFLTDINHAALRLARLNAEVAGVAAETVLGDVLTGVPGALDWVISNPPYLTDDRMRAYRHGGGTLGRALSLRIADTAMQRLRVGGRLLLYTGVAIVDGIDPLRRELQELFGRACDWHYAELDPDVFGEELERPAYIEAERIAAVGLVAVKR